jgi:hypothetical protein
MKDENGKKFYATIKIALRNENDRGRPSYSAFLSSAENLKSKIEF